MPHEKGHALFVLGHGSGGCRILETICNSEFQKVVSAVAFHWMYIFISFVCQFFDSLWLYGLCLDVQVFLPGERLRSVWAPGDWRYKWDVTGLEALLQPPIGQHAWGWAPDDVILVVWNLASPNMTHGPLPADSEHVMWTSVKLPALI